MANSEYEYVKKFEQWDALPPANWIVVRVDGRGFSKLCKKYDFEKPNDRGALDLLNEAAWEVIKSFVDIVLAYGQSDFNCPNSFVLHKSTTLFERRASKLATSIATAFTAEYCMRWSTHFPDKPLTSPWPTFDGRCVCYPTREILRDYLSWRQADCHINNLYNTTFWNLVLKGGMSGTEAEEFLKGTVASDKNEILFSRFGVNYNNEPELNRKGTVLYRAYDVVNDAAESAIKRAKADPSSKSQLEKERKRKQKARIEMQNIDLIRDRFWQERAYILAEKVGHVLSEE
ncbi:putative tRNAHis guanylyltransferase Thg1 [Polychaeton citri CBS 116435]|uniref:tRNA(His) guanylyltransferase n=1 Tax=Polychaeton citri CBS 116435 TaxID=1314669 RepID=A0A9P4PYR7_9PEZI|nr:putative tRNAHis guanylyltransferase Thg1 [Polychaeton citri CBS 116435]